MPAGFYGNEPRTKDSRGITLVSSIDHSTGDTKAIRDGLADLEEAIHPSLMDGHPLFIGLDRPLFQNVLGIFIKSFMFRGAYLSVAADRVP